MQIVLSGLIWTDVLCYLDDCCVIGKDFSHHLSNLRKVLNRFRKHNLKLKPKKCAFFQSEIAFLGKLVSRDGVAIHPDKVKAVKKWPRPKSVKDVESFLGFANYHRAHIEHYAHVSAPLYELTGPRVKFAWDDKHEDAFNAVKELLLHAPVLSFPDTEREFILDTDASDQCIGAELVQIFDGVEKVVQYGSFSLTPSQRNYCTTRKELLAIVRFTREYRHYLLGKPFTVRTDHNSLIWLMRFKDINGQLARWLEELGQYDMKIVHRVGNKHSNADGLSRIPDELEYCKYYRAGCKLEELPCGGCPFCT